MREWVDKNKYPLYLRIAGFLHLKKHMLKLLNFYFYNPVLCPIFTFFCYTMFRDLVARQLVCITSRWWSAAL